MSLADELLSWEDLDIDYDPEEGFEFDGPDELMQLDDMEIGLEDAVITKMEGPEAAAGS